ncbi:MAG: putative PurR-regulated permease PerM [Flammeovirgaceae bacterium]|jgi:predicted PurR-regulated permease PerM
MQKWLNKTSIMVVAMIAIAVYLAWFFSDIVGYVVISLIIASILRTPTNYISQFQIFGLHIPRVFAIGISFSILFGIITLFIFLFAPLVATQFKAIESIDVEKKMTEIKMTMAKARAEKQSSFLTEAEDLMQNYSIIKKDSNSMIEAIRTGYMLKKKDLADFRVGSVVSNLLTFTSSFFITLIAVLFITFFFLYEKGSIRKYILSLIPNRYFEVTIVAVTKVEKLLANYLLGIFLQMISIFSIASFGLILLDVEYAVTIAAFAAVVNLIPFLGPLLGSLFGIIVSLSTMQPLDDAFVLIAKVAVVFGVVQLADNLFLQPLIFSRSVKAHPLEIFLTIFVGATIGGAVGMIFAIPAYTILKVSSAELMRGYRDYRVFRGEY